MNPDLKPVKQSNQQRQFQQSNGKFSARKPRNKYVPPAGHININRRNIPSHLIPTKKDRKRVKDIRSKNKNISVEAAYAKTSSLAPTRLALNIEIDRVMAVLGNFATLMSYHIQSVCTAPSVDPSSDLNGWNPSLINAYLISITTGRLLAVGALSASNQIQVMGHYSVPTAFAKWLQQISPSTHMGREIVPTCADSTTAFLSYNCGTGGISNIARDNDGYAEAPVFAPVDGDTEGWWTCSGNDIPIIPNEVTAQMYSKISSVITKAFTHHVTVSEIPMHASNSELKCTPIADGEYGQFMFSCIDPEVTCDLLLPMCSIYSNNLVNSLNSTFVPSPVRVDGGLCIAPEAKFAFMFYLANKYPFRAKDSFVYYLRKFGLKDHSMSNAIINIRQINWNGVLSQCVQYIKTLSGNLGADAVWYLFNYAITILVSNIPGAFRAISPVQRQWGVAPLFGTTNNQPNYSAFAHTPKLPPFLANIIKALREPIRYENQISFYVSILPDANTGFWWQTAATASGVINFTTSPYGQSPSTIWNTNTILSSSLKPYPGWTTLNSGYGDQMRNYVTLFGMAALNTYFQNNFQQPNGGLNLYNGWLAKATNFTKRHAKFYIPTELDGVNRITYPSGQGIPTITIDFLKVKQIFSNEPTSHHAAVLALGHVFGYYSPSDIKEPFTGPVFAAQPVVGAETCTSTLISSESPGQGSVQMGVIAKSANPQEVTAHLGAESVEDIIPDNSEEPDPSVKKQVFNKFVSKLSTGVEDAAKLGGDVVSDFVKAL